MSKQLGLGEARSSGAIPQRRVKQIWPRDKEFRILSIDGGGIKGIFPATVLAELERRLPENGKIADYFDLIAGTSTGGILALGLGAKISAEDLSKIYTDQGRHIFPPFGDSCVASVCRYFSDLFQLARYRYERDAISALLNEALGDRLLGDSYKRLCIPSFEAKHSEVCVYKTPHHPDYKTDLHMRMTQVGLATSAAPGYFKPLEHDGYTLLDGGVWANNPIFIAVLEALTAFDVSPDQIKVLSIGCGDDPYYVSNWQRKWGGFFFWRKIIEAAMRLQSLNATNQARLLLSPQNVTRIDPPQFTPKIDLDDWVRAKELLPSVAISMVGERFEQLKAHFLYEPVAEYIPFKLPA